MRRSPVLGVRRRTAKAAINELERLGELVIEYEPAAAVRLRLARQGQRRHETPRPANPPRRPPRRRRSVASLPSSCARGSGAPDVRRRATDKRPGRVVIVGAGPADLTGAVYAASDGLRTLVTGLCDDCSASAKQNCECGQSGARRSSISKVSIPLRVITPASRLWVGIAEGGHLASAQLRALVHAHAEAAEAAGRVFELEADSGDAGPYDHAPAPADRQQHERCHRERACDDQSDRRPRDPAAVGCGRRLRALHTA
jgi:hypothetical protein